MVIILKFQDKFCHPACPACRYFSLEKRLRSNPMTAVTDMYEGQKIAPVKTSPVTASASS
jgi:hypothetical protein